MSKAVKELLNNIDRSLQSEYVFCNKDGEPVKSVRTGFKAALRRAGIEDFKWHDLRHTAASHLIMAGAELMTVKEILGHKTLEMTLRYSHLSQDHKTRAIDLLDSQLATNSATPNFN